MDHEKRSEEITCGWSVALSRWPRTIHIFHVRRPVAWLSVVVVVAIVVGWLAVSYLLGLYSVFRCTEIWSGHGSFDLFDMSS